MITEYQGFQIKPSKEFPVCLVVATAGKGGKIPNVLDGLFTSRQLAKDKIDHYLSQKEKPNDKSISKG